MDYEHLIQEAEAICAALSDEDDALKRDILGHAGNRWSLSVVHLLGVEGTLRHAAIARRVGGVTQRMLTRTLRGLDHNTAYGVGISGLTNSTGSLISPSLALQAFPCAELDRYLMN